MRNRHRAICIGESSSCNIDLILLSTRNYSRKDSPNDANVKPRRQRGGWRLRSRIDDRLSTGSDAPSSDVLFKKKGTDARHPCRDKSRDEAATTGALQVGRFPGHCFTTGRARRSSKSPTLPAVRKPGSLAGKRSRRYRSVGENSSRHDFKR